MNRNASTASVLAACLLAGCSLVKLSDDINQENCTNDADCDVLNDRKAKDFDPCDLWQCRPATKLCEKFALDQDHDGFTPAVTAADGADDIMCEVATEKQDCDDDNDARKPGNKERCDDLDNDCDLHVDEGALVPTLDVAVAFNGANIDGAGDVSYAVDPGTGAVALAYSINRTPNNVPGFSLLKNDMPSGATAAPLQLPAGNPRLLFADSVGIGPLGASKFAVAFFNRSGQRLVAGIVDAAGGGAPVLEASNDVLDDGLKCAAGLTCAGKSTQTPGIASLGDDVLVAYVLAESDPSQACHAKADSVPAHPLLANLLATSNAGLVEQTSSAIEVAQSSALEAPAILGIPTSAGSATFGWLIAYVDEEGAIVLRQVGWTGTALDVSAPLLTISDAGHRHSNVRLTLGPSDGDARIVGLAFQRGCTVAARVGAQLLEVSVASGEAKVMRSGGEVLVGGAANETRPSIAYAAMRDVWGVAYRDPAGLRARLFDPKGRLLGTEAYELLATQRSGTDKRELLLSPAIVASKADGWFFGLSYAQRGGATPQVVESASLASCGKQD